MVILKSTLMLKMLNTLRTGVRYICT